MVVVEELPLFMKAVIMQSNTLGSVVSMKTEKNKKRKKQFERGAREPEAGQK